MSVATTRRASRAACSAWMPHPVPRSSTRVDRVGQQQPAERDRGAADPEHVIGAQRARRWRARRGRSRSTTAPAPRASRKAYGRRSSSGDDEVVAHLAQTELPRAGEREGRQRASGGIRSVPAIPSTNSRARVARGDSSSRKRSHGRHPVAALERRLAASPPQSAPSASTVKRAAPRSARRRSTARGPLLHPSRRNSSRSHKHKHAASGARAPLLAQSLSTERMLPAGSGNQAMSGPRFAALPRAIPFSSWCVPS